MEFWRIYNLVRAKIWPILILVAIAVVTVFVLKKVADKDAQYQASALVLPSQRAMAPAGLYQDNGKGVLSPTYDRNSRLALFVESIKSSAVRDVPNLAAGPVLDQKKEVVRALTGQMSPEQNKSVMDLLKDSSTPVGTFDKVLTAYHIPTDPVIWQQRSGDLTGTLRDNLSVSQQLSNEIQTSPGTSTAAPTPTDYLGISIHDKDSNEAVQLANLVAARFVNSYVDEGKQEYDASISNVLKTQREAIAKVTKAQTALLTYKKSHNLVDINSQASAEVNRLESMISQRGQAQIQLATATQNVATLDGLIATTPPSTVTEFDPGTRPQVQDLEARIVQLQNQIKTLNGRYTPAAAEAVPEYRSAVSQLKAAQATYNDLLKHPFKLSQINPQYQTLKNQRDSAIYQRDAAQKTVNSLTAQINTLQAQNTATLPDAQKRLSDLQIILDTALASKKFADQAVDSLKDTDKLLDQGLIELTNPAVSALPDSGGPSLPMLLAYATLLSLIVGIGAVIGLDALDNKVQTIPDAEKLLGMPVSAVIPAFPAGGDLRRTARMVVSEPLSPIAESYRLLRTDLLFTAEDKPFKSLMAATAKPGQGATTTICNLAVALASVGKRVVLIDADLRRPKLHDYFSVPNDTGLTSLLLGECEMEEALKVTDIDNLLVLPSGPLPLNPSELLASQRMRTLHERLKPHTDFILVDTPSAIAFSDSAILSSFMDAVMLVVRAQEAPRGSEVQVKEMLNKARANVIGVVLNGVKPQLVDSYHFHAAYYPQVSMHNGNGHALPAPSNGNGNGHVPSLDGDTLGHRIPANAFAKTDGAALGNGTADDIEATAIMDDIVDVKPQKSRFNLRSLFGTDDKDGR